MQKNSLKNNYRNYSEATGRVTKETESVRDIEEEGERDSLKSYKRNQEHTRTTREDTSTHPPPLRWHALALPETAPTLIKPKRPPHTQTLRPRKSFWRALRPNLSICNSFTRNVHCLESCRFRSPLFSGTYVVIHDNVCMIVSTDAYQTTIC